MKPPAQSRPQQRVRRALLARPGRQFADELIDGQFRKRGAEGRVARTNTPLPCRNSSQPSRSSSRYAALTVLA